MLAGRVLPALLLSTQVLVPEMLTLSSPVRVLVKSTPPLVLFAEVIV